MEDNVIKVSVRPNKQNSVKVSSNVVSTPITANSDTSQLWSQVSKNWAVSETIVDNTGYSSKYYANKAKESASNAQGFESAIRDVYNGFLGETTEAIENVQVARDEAIANIDTLRVEAIDSINSTKTTILNDIEFVADGEKQEIQNLADEIKDSGDTVNIAIEAGVERLNSIDALKKSQITNCLLEVPQNIKLELNNGVLTLKAGSKVIVPNGVGVFDEVVIDADKTYKTTANGTLVVLVNTTNKTMFISVPSKTISGDTDTLSTTTYRTWYDTANNLVKRYNANASTIDFYCSLPIALVTVSNGAISSIDQVFNGFGYIGSTVWVDKGVKGLIPNGRNEDGSLNNVEYTTTSVSLNSDMHKWGGQFTLNIMLYNQGSIAGQDVNRFTKNKETPVPTSQYVYSYDEEDNYWYYSTDNGVNWVIQRFITIGSLTEVASNKSVSNFQPKQPFRAVDYNEFNSIPHITETYVNGTSWYRIWSDGWIEQGGRITSTASTTIAFPKKFSNTNYTITLSQAGSSSSKIARVAITAYQTASFTVQELSSNMLPASWYACGY